MTMADEALPPLGLRDEAVKGHHVRNLGFESLSALFHSRHHNTFNALCLYLMPLAVVTVEKSEGIQANLGSLFHKPFRAVNKFGGGHSQMDASLPQRLLGKRGRKAVKATVAGGTGDARLVEVAFPIHQEKGVTDVETQHTQGMACFLLGQFTIHLRGVEIVLLLHCLG